MRTALVTGATGLLGGWVVHALLERGVAVVALKRDGVASSALALEGLEERCTVVHGSLLDSGLLDRAIGEYAVDTVFHLAAQTIVATANRSPLSTFESNVRGTWLLMEACRLQGVARVVVAASDKAYGPHEHLPYREDFALQPRHPYDVSKAATDLIARSYFHTYGLPVAVTRLANVYGGGDLNPSRLVPELVAAVLGGRDPVIRSDGSPRRDFLFAQDAAAAYLALADALGNGSAAAGQAFNAGGDAPHRVSEVVELLVELSGGDVTPRYAGRGVPPGEIDAQWVDSTKLRRLTGWTPQVGLHEGLRRTLEWYRRFPQALGLPRP